MRLFTSYFARWASYYLLHGLLVSIPVNFELSKSCRWNHNNFNFRHIVQDPRDLPSRLLRPIHRSLHVLCQHLQHLHENFLHISHCDHNLDDALQTSILHNLRQYRRLVPPPQSLATCRPSAHMHFKHRMDHLAIFMELLFVAGSNSIRAANRHAPQDARRWEPDVALCSVPWTLSVLLHS